MPALKAAQVSEAVEDQSPREMWRVVRNQLSWHTVDHGLVDQEFEWYRKHPAYLYRVSERATPYLHFIVETIRDRGLPMELALLPIVESAYDPFAYSHGRAAGLWQFIPGTGREFGLQQNWWYDGRRDVTASTLAAFRYLEQLNLEFGGDWFLALAAYNAGPRRVARAMEFNDKQGKEVDFFSLKLPKETTRYVPKLLALSRIFSAPEKYGVTLAPIPNQPYFAKVDTQGQMDLALAADLANIPVEEVYQLNPGFSRWATDPDGPESLLIPIAARDDFTQALASLPEERRISWSRYKIRPGDTLGAIARRTNTSVDFIQRTNDLSSSRIVAGQTLLLPKASAPALAYAASAANRGKRAVRKGEGTKSTYRVRSGDNLWSIAQSHGVSSKQLASWNGLALRDPIHPGQELILWLAGPSSALPGQRDSSSRKVNYRVRKGDSLARIARKFSVSVASITRWNTLDPADYLQPGQKLVLFVEVVGG